MRPRLLNDVFVSDTRTIFDTRKARINEVYIQKKVRFLIILAQL